MNYMSLKDPNELMTYSLKIPKRVSRKIKMYCFGHDTSMSKFINELLENFIKNEIADPFQTQEVSKDFKYCASTSSILE